MVKKLASVLLAAAMIFSLGVNAFALPIDDAVPAETVKAADKAAGDTEKDASNVTKDAPKVSFEDILNHVEDILNKATEETDESKDIFNITKPNNGKDSTYKRAYDISGVTSFEDVKIILEKYNSESKAYEPLKDEDGVYQYDVGSFGVFAKAIKLDKNDKGVNKLRLRAYRTSLSEKLTLTVEDVQVKYLTITLLNESIKDKILNTFNKIINNVGDFTKIKLPK